MTIRPLLWLALALMLARPAAAHWVDGYYVGYEHDLYPPAKVDFSSLSHIMVGRYVPNKDGSLDTTCDWDPALCPPWAKGMGVRAHAAGKQAILFLGGAGAHDGFAAAAAPAVRPTFVKAILAAVKSLNFDGVDLDWEPIDQADRPDLIALARALRRARPTMTITLPIDWINPNLGSSDYAWTVNLIPSLDQLNIMTYGMDDSAWAPYGWTTTWFTSALSAGLPQSPSSVVSSVNGFINHAHIPPAKLGIGIGFYGQCWTGGVTGPRQPVGGSTMVASDGTMSFAHIMDGYYQSSAYSFDTAAAAPYLGAAAGLGSLGCTYISYENERSIAAKANYVKSRGLGGAIIWTISQGYRASTGKNTVLTAAGRILP